MHSTGSGFRDLREIGSPTVGDGGAVALGGRTKIDRAFGMAGVKHSSAGVSSVSPNRTTRRGGRAVGMAGVKHNSAGLSSPSVKNQVGRTAHQVLRSEGFLCGAIRAQARATLPGVS